MAEVIFVCWGNICRSTMAEQVAREMARQQGLRLDVDSAGVSAEESGNLIDPRARRTLEAHGYSAGNHRAKRITAEEIVAADFVIAAESHHIDRLLRIVPDADNLHLIRDFDPSVPPGTALPDPWYGDEAGFEVTLTAIEQAMPGILAAVVAHRE